MKRKHIIILSAALVCAIAVAVGAFWAFKAYQKNKISFVLEDTLPDGEGKSATNAKLMQQNYLFPDSESILYIINSIIIKT